MAELPSMNWWADAYWADTRGLTLEEHGAYRTLIDIAWRLRAGPIPDDDKRIALMLGISRARWLKLKPQVMQFWELEAGGWTQKRIKKEWFFARNRSAAASQNANKRWHAKPLKNNGGGDAVADAVADAVGNAECMLPLTTDHREKETTNVVSKKRGSRLPENWQPSAVGVEFARKAGHAAGAVAEMADSFRDYWLGVPGQRGCKLDWEATWRNWVRNNGRKANGKQRPFYASESGFEYRGSPEQMLAHAKRRHDWATAGRIERDMRGEGEAREVGEIVQAIVGRVN